MTARVAGQRFRQRKLSTKQNLPVITERELETTIDDDATRHIPKVETGVEKGEEVEHHLQAVISAAQAAAQGGGTVAQLYIPTPDAVASKIQYESLYPKRFTQPATYIRFSSTVEDTIGCQYCMTSEDAAFLQQYNGKRDATSQCSEDDFEHVMNFFEETSQTKQPYASVDNTPVLSFEELEAEYDETISESARRFAKDIYDHWKNQRMLKNNRPLIASLKFEMNLETDDADPYVCFRRREVRQVRKTRGRDAQVTEKLKKLRKELEEARFLMSQVRRRELMAKDQLRLDKQIFDQRCELKDIKRKLNIKDKDEELLINQKPVQKPKPRVDSHAVRQGIPGMASKPQLARADGRLVDDLVHLDEQLAKKAEVIDHFIEENVQRHAKWNIGWIDNTWRPITPPQEPPEAKSSFRTVYTTSSLLPTPPASVSDDAKADGTGDAMDVDQGHKQPRPQQSGPNIRYASPPSDVPAQQQMQYRLRTGRGGQLWLDRRGGNKRQKVTGVDPRVADRYRFDDSSDDDDDEPLYECDWTNDMNIRYRIMIDKQQDKAQQAHQAAQHRRAAIENSNRSTSGHLMPPTTKES